MPEYRLTCRADLQQAGIAQLDQAGMYRSGGASTRANTARLNHELCVTASTEEEAVGIAREAVEAAGGDGSDIEGHGPVG